MAHYAFLDDNNVVTQVIVGKDENEDGIDWERFYGATRTSYNTRSGIYYDPVTREPAQDQSKAFRKNYAGIGYSYDPARDAFIPPKPFDSWILDEFSCTWNPPVDYPSDGDKYTWNESLLEWIIVNNGEK